MSSTRSKPYDHLFKLVLIGDGGVGKSCLLGTYSSGDFYESYMCTIGIDFQIKTILIDGKTIKIQIWDTAGQERFGTMSSAIYRGSHGIIIVYDICDRGSYIHVSTNWLPQVDKFAAPNVVKVLVGNKSDNTRGREVTFDEVQEFSRLEGITFFETSAKENINVNEVFEKITHEIMVSLPNDDLQESEHLSVDEKNTKQCSCSQSSPKTPREVQVDGRAWDASQASPVVYKEEKNASPVTDKSIEKWRSDTLALYEKNKTGFESYRVRPGWFISYKQKDSSDVLAERLYRDLEGDNWFDMYYNKTRTRAAMIKGILRRDKFVCFLSPSYFQSQWCVMELTTAFCGGKTIVPVFNQDSNTAGSMLSSVPECFESLKKEDFIGVFADTVPYRAQMIKIVNAGIGRSKGEFYDSEMEFEDVSEEGA